MSPILKRDVGEQIRQAKRLAAAVTGNPPPLDSNYDHIYQEEDVNGNAYATSSKRRSIGKLEDEDDPGPRRSWEGRTYVEGGKGKERDFEEVEVEEGVAMLGFEDDSFGTVGIRTGESRRRSLGEWFKDEVLTMSPGRWIDLRNLLLEVRPSLHCYHRTRSHTGNARPTLESRRDDLHWRTARTSSPLDSLLEGRRTIHPSSHDRQLEGESRNVSLSPLGDLSKYR